MRIFSVSLVNCSKADAFDKISAAAFQSPDLARHIMFNDKSFDNRGVCEILRQILDNLPVKKGQTFIDNWELSTERALSVLRFFIKNGLNPKRLSASGYGSFQPIETGENSDSRSKNRRIEMKITQKLGLID